MRRGRAPTPEPAGRTAPSRSVGEMKAEQADYARDAKKEEAMCASATCQVSHGLKKAPKGYVGRYGGHQLCEKHYEKVVDSLLESLIEHGCAPWEMSQDGDDDSKDLEDLFK